VRLDPPRPARGARRPPSRRPPSRRPASRRSRSSCPACLAAACLAALALELPRLTPTTHRARAQVARLTPTTHRARAQVAPADAADTFAHHIGHKFRGQNGINRTRNCRTCALRAYLRSFGSWPKASRLRRRSALPVRRTHPGLAHRPPPPRPRLRTRPHHPRSHDPLGRDQHHDQPHRQRRTRHTTTTLALARRTMTASQTRVKRNSQSCQKSIDKRVFYVKTDFRRERRHLPRPDRAG